MLISCRFSTVGIHLLLLTHLAHSFVLLTANVDDVKKIARKFVSDSLAEKIVDFIAKATKSMAQKKEISEENDDTIRHDHSIAREGSQVSAENRMYNSERHGDDSQAAEFKSKEEIVLGKVTVKVPKKTFVEKKRYKVEEPSTTRKPKKEPKPLHGRSRYIVQSENKGSLATEEAHKINEVESFNKIKESIQLLEDNLFSTSDGRTKNKKQKRKVKGRAYKLLSGVASVENYEAKSGIPDSKGTKPDEILFHARAVDDEKTLTSPTEEAATRIKQHDIENEKQADKAATDVTQQENKDNESTEKVVTGEPLHLTGKDEFDQFENKIIHKTEKVVGGPRAFAEETDVKEENWWEKELPAGNHDVNAKKKSWF